MGGSDSACSAYILYKTRWGLNVRAVGDNPKAAATAGLSVIRLKYQTVILSGISAALGGCVLTLGEVGYFSAGGMAAGRGFIVMAACVVGGWDPIRTAVVCLAFGAADAAQLRFQTTGSVIPYQFLQMLPYIVTIIALTIMVNVPAFQRPGVRRMTQRMYKKCHIFTKGWILCWI